MAIDSVTPRTRRAIIMAGLGGVAATVAGALGRPAQALAADGDPVLIGAANSASSATSISVASATAHGLTVSIASNGGTGRAFTAAASDATAVRATSRTSSATVHSENIGGPNSGPAVFAKSGDTSSESQPAVGATIHAHQTDAIAGRRAILAEAVGSGANGVEAYAGNTGVLGAGGVQGVLGQSDAGSGVEGTSSTGRGVLGKSTSGIGIRGESSQGTGIRAIGAKGRALLASTTSTSLPAIASQTTGTKSAIQGFAGPGTIPAPSPETGVQGRADKSENSVGVLGESSLGTGVVGASDTGYGVFGVGYYGVYAFGQVGVVGDVDSGTGIQGWTGQALAPNPPPNVGVWAGGESGRTALEVSGVTKFSRSGKTTFSAGQSSKKITVPGGITAGSFAFADLQQDRPGVLVRAVVPNTADSSITIVLNATVASTTAVGWMVVG